MDSNDSPVENSLSKGLQALRDLLGGAWEVTLRADPTAAARSTTRHVDALVELKPTSDGHVAQLLVDVRDGVTPRTVETELLPKLDLLRQVNHYTSPLVISPWISPRVQELLREHDINYLDFTGNVSLRTPRPTIVIRTQGDARSPRSVNRRSEKATLAGPKVGKLVRLLADVSPPYRAGELAEAARLSLPYVSRLLGTLEDQLLIRRQGRIITTVDWVQLLRARAEQLNLLRHNPYVGMVSPNGIDATLATLRGMTGEERGRVAVTGSYAAHSVAPLAVGGQLMLYVPHGPHTPDDLGDRLGLLRVDQGANVLLLRAHDEVVFARTADMKGLRRVALSQLVLDCLSGPGRMPAEGRPF